jgi:hypothetical protein
VENLRAKVEANVKKAEEERRELEQRAAGTLTQAWLKEIVHYEPDTGTFTRLTGQNKGKKAGYLTEDGYVSIEILGVVYPAHRLAWYFVKGVWPEGDIDHIDRCRTNNKFDNLRDVTRSINLFNRGMMKNNTSGVRNVYWAKKKKKWVVNKNENNKRIYVGSYDTLEEAAEEAKKYYGDTP